MNVTKIMDIIPHRYPFLLVDKVIKIENNTIEAVKCVTINEPFFQGHFPGEPIMPGVLIVEALAQSGGILVHEIIFEGKTPDKFSVYFMSIDNVKFRKPVVPGDQLILKVEILKSKRSVYSFSGKAYVDNTLVCESEFLAMIRVGND